MRYLGHVLTCLLRYPPSSISAHDYVTAPAPGLLAPNPKYFSESGDIVPIHPNHFERVKLARTPDTIRWDGLDLGAQL